MPQGCHLKGDRGNFIPRNYRQHNRKIGRRKDEGACCQ
uniref:Uncharacterized protein n=1 Tax=Myoviridae sp. ctp7F23 TaxID=2825174 RepID=A0A8S5U8P0_9CAUD|nr:MAG TPA: hypothetical protein [Myoviridae sp. ctp7F23]